MVAFVSNKNSSKVIVVKLQYKHNHNLTYSCYQKQSVSSKAGGLQQKILLPLCTLVVYSDAVVSVHVIVLLVVVCGLMGMQDWKGCKSLERA